MLFNLTQKNLLLKIQHPVRVHSNTVDIEDASVFALATCQETVKRQTRATANGITQQIQNAKARKTVYNVNTLLNHTNRDEMISKDIRSNGNFWLKVFTKRKRTTTKS